MLHPSQNSTSIMSFNPFHRLIIKTLLAFPSQTQEHRLRKDGPLVGVCTHNVPGAIERADSTSPPGHSAPQLQDFTS